MSKKTRAKKLPTVSNNDVANAVNITPVNAPEIPNVVTINPIRWVGVAMPNAADLWDFNTLKVPFVWTHYGTQGEGVNVIVIDSGVDVTHPAFAHHTTVNTRSFLPTTKSVVDGTGHGTWVASKIAGGGVGIAPKCNLWCLRVLDESGTGSTTFSTNALQWVLDNVPNPHIINMSMGGYTPSDQQKAVLGKLADKGVLVVAAMGNEGSTVPMYPAGFDRLLAVGAVNKDNTRAAFSNYGANVDIVAPGVACYSAYLGGKFRKMEGTSMATPIITGMLTLGWSYLMQHRKDITSIRGAVMDALEKTASDLGDAGRDDTFGWGLVDGERFMEKLASL